MLFKQKYFVYFLRDPEVDNLGYIGYTNNTKTRLWRHCNLNLIKRDKSIRAIWIRNLINRNLKPTIEIIKEFRDEKSASDYEIKQIAKYKLNGYMLLNSTPGGELGGIRGRFPIEKQLEIVENYKNTTISTTELGINYSCAKSTIRRILTINNVPVRRKITLEQKLEICNLYVNHNKSSGELSNLYKITASYILHILRDNGVTPKNCVEAHGGLSTIEELEVAKRYTCGESPTLLAAEYDVHPCTVTEIVKRQGIKVRKVGGYIRPQSKNKDGISLEQEQYVCENYTKISYNLLATEIGCSISAIYSILRRNNIRRRSAAEAAGGLDEFEEYSLCIQYINGKGPMELSRTYDVTDMTVRNIFRRRNVPRRTSRKRVRWIQINPKNLV